MDKSVLISIRPKWCEKIVNGEKTIEVRKTRPKLQTPFKCYIYCTMDHPYISVSCGELDKLNYRTNTVCRCNGKVIGEFTCDRIDRLAPANDPYGIYDIDDDYVARTCLLYGDMWNYGKGKPLFGWTISDFQLCDIPSELGMFEITRPPQSWCYVEGGV